jgi:glutamate 5-kinase
MVFIQNHPFTMRSQTISLVTDLQLMQQEVGDSKSSQGTGGMQSKIEAAAIKAANIETWVVNSKTILF